MPSFQAQNITKFICFWAPGLAGEAYSTVPRPIAGLGCLGMVRGSREKRGGEEVHIGSQRYRTTGSQGKVRVRDSLFKFSVSYHNQDSASCINSGQG